MQITQGPLDGLLIIQPSLFTDERGYFFEMFQQQRYIHLPHFVQDNLSRSKQHVLRGLHYQYPMTQGKLVGVIRGTVWDIVVDIRLGSPTFGQWFHFILSDENHIQIHIPAGFAHGFCVLSEEADFYYKCTDYYSPQAEKGILWNDPDLNISWPIHTPLLSPKDLAYPYLKNISKDQLVQYTQSD